MSIERRKFLKEEEEEKKASRYASTIEKKIRRSNQSHQLTFIYVLY